MKTKLVFAALLLLGYFLMWFTHQPASVKQPEALAQFGAHSAQIAPDATMFYLNMGWVPIGLIVLFLIWSALKTVASIGRTI